MMTACALFACLVVWIAAPRKVRMVPGKRMEAYEGEVEKDEEGIQLVESLGQRMAWLMKKFYG